MLKEDLKQSSDAQQAAPHEYAESVRMRQQNMLPQDLAGGSARHCNSVLHALSSLASNRAKTRPDANRPIRAHSQLLGRYLRRPADAARLLPVHAIADSVALR